MDILKNLIAINNQTKDKIIIINKLLYDVFFIVSSGIAEIRRDGMINVKTNLNAP